MRALFQRIASGLFALILLIAISQNLSGQEAKYCCERDMVFPAFPMPEGQERDISGFISARWMSLILKEGPAKLGECPIPLTLMSWEGSLELDSMVERMSAAVQKTKPEFQSPEESLKNFEYIWRGQLELISINKIVPGEWEDAYIDENTKPGAKHYEPGMVWGRWRFTIQLYNPQWDEIVKEATTPEWDGAGDHYSFNVVQENIKKGIPDGPFDDLYNENFKDLKQILYDYEQIPVKAELTPKNKSIEAGEKTTIRLKLWDYKDLPPKHWQRIMVEVNNGTLENGIGCVTDCPNNRYAFMCDDGEIELKYVAPPDCNIKNDHITVYNTCQTHHPSVVRLGVWNDEQDVIGETDLEITCNKARLIIDYEESSSTNGNGINARETIRARISVDLKAEGIDVPMGADSKHLYSTYKLTNARLENFTASYEYHKHTEDENEDYMCSNADPVFSGILAPLFTIYYDAKSRNAISAVIPEFGTEYLWVGSKECRSEPDNPDNIAIAPVEEIDNEDELDVMAEKMEQLASQFDITEEDFEEELKKQKTDTTGKYPKGVTPVEQFDKNIPFKELIETSGDISSFLVTNPDYEDWKATGTDMSARGSGRKTSMESKDGLTRKHSKTYAWHFRRGK